MAHFKPLPFIHRAENEEDSEHEQSPAVSALLAINPIRRKPAPVSTPRNNDISSSVITPIQPNITALPAVEAVTNSEAFTYTVNTAVPVGAAAVETTDEADESQLRLSAQDLYLSPCVSLSKFPAPPNFPSLDVSDRHTRCLYAC